VNKSDLDPAAARRAALQLGASLGPRGPAQVVSALTGEGIGELWSAIEASARVQRDSGARDRRRREQNVAWLRDAVREGLRTQFENDVRVRSLMPGILLQAESGQLPPPAAARMLLAAFLEDKLP
jgi:LAO/AO transport system kinase